MTACDIPATVLDCLFVAGKERKREHVKHVWEMPECSNLNTLEAVQKYICLVATITFSVIAWTVAEVENNYLQR